ncbi:MAG: DUF3237 domain-containing protein [Nostoc sp.]|uniref:DUF3237 domain-containing protein n=1 Tax=Nostoc sp. TaxID=1180 RepID=UPI002FF413CD
MTVTTDELQLMNDELQLRTIKKRISRRGLIKGASLTAVAAAGAAGVNSLSSKPVNAEVFALSQKESQEESQEEKIVKGCKEEFLFEVNAILEVPKEFRTSPKSARGLQRIVNITGGSFAGPKLKGTVLPGGNYWIFTRSDGGLEIDARTVLHTENGHLIYTSYQGIVQAPPAIMQRLRSGESKIDPSEYYYRTNLNFETGAKEYNWLNPIVAVGIGKRTPTGVTYQVYTIL